MELTRDVSKAVDKYFSYIKHTGYKPYHEVYELLVYCFIEELLTGELSYFITDEDYKIIAKSLECLYGTCMIPFPDYLRSADRYKPLKPRYRGSEMLDFRESESSILRVES